MNIKIRKQFSKAYQVFEIELDNVDQDKINSANAWMDAIGIKEVNNMAKLVNQPDSTEFVLTNIDELPAYNNTPRPRVTSGKPASPKQIEWLDKYNIAYNPATITSAEASKLLDAVFKNDYTQPNKKNDNLPF